MSSQPPIKPSSESPVYKAKGAIAATGPADEMPSLPVVNPFVEFFYFFRQNRGAMIGLGILFVFGLIAAFAPFVAPHDPTQVFSDSLRVGPIWTESGSWSHILGTDDIGRDVLSRLIYGARVSIGVGLLVMTIAVTLGTLLGLIAGYFGGWVDTVIIRATDVLMAIPSILLALIVVAILGPSLINAVWAVGVVAICPFIRLVRASVMAEKVKQYVVASECFGASHMRQIFVNILPNCVAPIIIQGTLTFSDGILNTAALGFLGLGAQPPLSEWGTMLADARLLFETYPWLITAPGICILLVVLACNLLGDGLRDAFDPRLRK